MIQLLCAMTIPVPERPGTSMMPASDLAPQAERSPIRTVRRALSAALGFGLVGCGTGIVETTVTNLQPLEPLPVYTRWWPEVEGCSGRMAVLDRVEWFTADGLAQNGRLVLARWEPPHRITVLSNQTHTEEVVKHEMLHDLLGGDPRHLETAWQACGL